MKEQESQKKLFNLKRAICIGGGLLLVLAVWALLIASSQRGTSGTSDGCMVCHARCCSLLCARQAPGRTCMQHDAAARAAQMIHVSHGMRGAPNSPLARSPHVHCTAPNPSSLLYRPCAMQVCMIS